MESGKVISTDKATVVIQVNPQVTHNTVMSDDGQQDRGAYHNTTLKGFFKAEPKALGTVQIMTGLMVFLLGIVLTAIHGQRAAPLSVFSGITFWGSLIYISAGSLSVAAQNKLHLCVVKASLIMNVLSAITAGIDITLKSIEITIINHPYYYEKYLGIIGLLLVFSILQFIISICISAFACKATCNRDSTVVIVTLKEEN